MSETEILDAFERLADIAIDHLVDLGAGKPEEGKLEKEKIESYQIKLQNRRDDRIPPIVTEICAGQEKLTRGEFQAKMASKGFSDLFTSSGLRGRIHGPL